MPAAQDLKRVASRQLASVTRDRLGRYIRIEKLRSCQLDGCALDDPTSAEQLLVEHDEFLASLEGWLAGDDATRADLAELVRSVRLDLRAEQADIVKQPLRVQPSDAPRSWASGQGIAEVLDVTGLDGRTASDVAILLRNWRPDGRGPVYRKDAAGRRRIRVGMWRVDLDHPTIRQLGWDEELREAAREPSNFITIEDWNAGEAAIAAAAERWAAERSDATHAQA